MTPLGGRKQGPYNGSRVVAKATLGVAGALSTVAMPALAYAGVFSLMLAFVSGVHYAPESAPQNSQTMPVLQAVLNPDPSGGRGGGDITIVGGVALLPESGPAGTIADIEGAKPGSDRISLYVVREGDTLSEIADMFGVSTNTIIWANDIKRGTLITPGQTLVILPITGVQYTVKKGDTIASIAKAFNGHAEEISQYNDLPENAVLAVGTTITIPDGEIAAPKPATKKPGSTARASSGPEYAGYYLKPVTGSVKTQGIHGYNGVDLAAPAGTAIVASASGRVIISRSSCWCGGYGNHVAIEHGNGTQTLYAHNASNIVSVGQYVVAGQIIAYIGSTGKSTGDHLHFEVRGAKNPF